MGEYAEMERQHEEDPLKAIGGEFTEMEERIEEYFSNVSDEQLAKDLKKAGYRGKFGPDSSSRWFAIGIGVGTGLVTLGYFVGHWVAWITWVPS